MRLRWHITTMLWNISPLSLVPFIVVFFLHLLLFPRWPLRYQFDAWKGVNSISRAGKYIPQPTLVHNHLEVVPQQNHWSPSPYWVTLVTSWNTIFVPNRVYSPHGQVAQFSALVINGILVFCKISENVLRKIS